MSWLCESQAGGRTAVVGGKVEREGVSDGDQNDGEGRLISELGGEEFSEDFSAMFSWDCCVD